MNKWRPDGWECKYLGKKANKYYELGATDMLEALKLNTMNGYIREIIPSQNYIENDLMDRIRFGQTLTIKMETESDWLIHLESQRCYLVFIPDDKES